MNCIKLFLEYVVRSGVFFSQIQTFMEGVSVEISWLVEFGNFLSGAARDNFQVLAFLVLAGVTVMSLWVIREVARRRD